MNQNEFLRLLGEAGNTTRTKAGKANWEVLIAEAKASGNSYTISSFHEHVVKGVVSRGRTGGKLNDLFKAKKVARLICNDGAYVYCFGADAIKIQHGE